MLKPVVDLTSSDTTDTPPIISVENETTEMEDSVIQDKHSYNTSTSHTTSAPIPVISIEEVQVGHWDEDENKTAIFYRWQQKNTSILNETEEQYDSQNNFILDEYSRNDVDDAIVTYGATICVTLIILFLILWISKRIYKVANKKKQTYHLHKQFPGLENAPVLLTNLPMVMPDGINNEQVSKIKSIYTPPKTEMASEKIETEAILHQPSDKPSDGTTDDFVNIGLKLAPHASTNNKRSSAPQLDGETEALEKSKVTDLQGVTLARR